MIGGHVRENKEYLGDSVYAEFDGNVLVLTTDNGLGPSNTIYLEPEVYGALAAFVDSRVFNAMIDRNARKE
jgi:hypothetical protein